MSAPRDQQPRRSHSKPLAFSANTFSRAARSRNGTGRPMSARTHGHATLRTAEYICWEGIKARCHRGADPDYSRYGGRGVIVCARWRNDFAAFLADMGPRPSPNHSIDRIDNDGNYEPGNCQWATRIQQLENRHCTIWLTAFGKTLSLREWCRNTGLHDSCVRTRLARGASHEEALRPSKVRRAS